MANSSIIEAIQYNAESGTLHVQLFTNTLETYQYEGIPQALYESFINAPSPGRFFNQFLRTLPFTTIFSPREY